MSFIREFLTKWTFDVDDKTLEKMNQKVKEIGDRMEKLDEAITKVGRATAGLGLAVAAIGAAVGGSFLLTKHVAELGNELAKTSQKLGISVEMLQKLRYAADLSDVSVGDLDTGIKFLAKNMDATDNATGAQAKAFVELGVSARFANGQLRPTDEVLIDLAERFSRMPDGAQKTAAALQIFGKAGSQLIPLLNEGRDGLSKLFEEAEAFGVITEQSAAASEEWLDGMTRVSRIVGRLAQMIGTVLVPVFADVTEQVREWFLANRELIKMKVGEFAERVAGALRFLWNMSIIAIRYLDRLASVMGGWESTLKKIEIALAVLAGGTILYAIGALTTALWTLGSAIASVGVSAAIAEGIIFAIPIAIGAAVVAVGLLIDDIITFFDGGESFFGDFIASIKDNLDDLKGAFMAIGHVITEYLFWPVTQFLEGLNKAIELLTGINVLTAIGMKQGEAGVKHRAALVESAANWLGKPFADMRLDDKNQLIPSAPVSNPNGEQARGLFTGLQQFNGGSSTSSQSTVNNDITINADGLDAETAAQVIKSALAEHDVTTRTQAGKYSQRKYRE